MNTSSLTTEAMKTIDEYLQFSIGSATCNIPYYNNKVSRRRGSLAVYVGKGSPKEIGDEIESIMIKNHIDKNLLGSDTLKKILVDADIGIDCSGYAYHILNAEMEAKGLGKLSALLKYTENIGLFGKFRAKLRPVENCSVAVLADEENSVEVNNISEVMPGDFIVMFGSDDKKVDRDHILIIYSIEKDNDRIVNINYTQSVAYPTDGVYGTGVRNGVIKVSEGDNLESIEHERLGTRQIRRLRILAKA